MAPDKKDINTGRSHMYQLRRNRFVNTPKRDGFLPNRITTTWNLFPPEITEAVNSLKTRIVYKI